MQIYDIMSAGEKQATPKAAFAFSAPLTSKQAAKQHEKRVSAGLRVYDIMSGGEKQATPKAAFAFLCH